MVFIHGYNVSFHRAARRTAQLAYDLDFAGVPLFYSWPSDGAFLRYTADEQDVRLTVPHLTEFLNDVVQATGAERVHVVAHSMGSRALAAALTDIGRDISEPVFGEVIFAAPDIAAREFRDIVAPAIDTSLLGHSYFADAIQLVRDLLSVILEGLPPSDRSLEARIRSGMTYWRFGSR